MLHIRKIYIKNNTNIRARICEGVPINNKIATGYPTLRNTFVRSSLSYTVQISFMGQSTDFAFFWPCHLTVKISKFYLWHFFHAVYCHVATVVAAAIFVTQSIYKSPQLTAAALKVFYVNIENGEIVANEEICQVIFPFTCHWFFLLYFWHLYLKC